MRREVPLIHHRDPTQGGWLDSRGRYLMVLAVALVAVGSVARAGGAEASEPALVAGWKLDGDLRDSSGGGRDLTGSRRLEFAPSPIGGSGQLLVCNGVECRRDRRKPRRCSFRRMILRSVSG